MFRRNESQSKRDGFDRISLKDNNKFNQLRKQSVKAPLKILKELSAGVGRGQHNNREDVARIEVLMEKRFL